MYLLLKLPFETSNLKTKAGIRYKMPLALLQFNYAFFDIQMFPVKPFYNRANIDKNTLDLFKGRDKRNLIDHNGDLLFKLLHEVLVIAA